MKKQYIAPLLTVVSFRVEKGYAESGVLSTTMNLFHEVELPNDYYNAQNQENWTEYNDGNGSSNLFGGW